jgi:hypothetical protein
MIQPPTTAEDIQVFLPNQLTVDRFGPLAAHPPPSARGYRKPLLLVEAAAFRSVQQHGKLVRPEQLAWSRNVAYPELDRDFCIVLADFGQGGQAFLETEPRDATFERAVADIIEGQVDRVVAVVQLNPSEGWSRDVTEDTAQAVSDRVCRDGEYPNETVRKLLDAFGLAYPAPGETSVWPRAMTSAEPERKVSTFSKQLEAASNMPKRPAAPSLSSLRQADQSRGGYRKRPEGRRD